MKGVSAKTVENTVDSTASESLEDDISLESSFTEVNENKTKPFTLENLNYFWSQFAKRFEHKDIRLYNILTNNKVEIRNEFEVHIGLYNSLQTDELERIKTTLTGYLVNNLENRNITIKSFIVEGDDFQKPLSANDKFDIMAKKNNNLNALKERLNLDFD